MMNYTDEIKLKEETTAVTAAQYEAYAAAEASQKINFCLVKDNYSISVEMGKTQPYIASGSRNESGSGIRLCPYVGQEDVKTKSGYSTEEDGTISLKTTASASSMTAWYPYSRFRNSRHPASDSDNNSMVVELSDEESTHQQMELPSKMYNKEVEVIIDKWDTKDRGDALSTGNNRRSSHFNRSISKCARLSNSFTDHKKTPNSPNSRDRPPTQIRRGRKRKWQQQQPKSCHASDANNSQDLRHSFNGGSTSTFIRNHPRDSFIKAPNLSYNFNLTISQSECHHSKSALPNPAVDSNLQETFKYKHPMQLPIYNNISVLPDTRPSMWLLGPIYFPPNPHIFLGYGQPHQHLPQAHLHQYSQPSTPLPSAPQMASIPTSRSEFIAWENLTGQSIAPYSTPTCSKQSTGQMIRPKLTWLRKEFLFPPTETGPDGNPIKVKSKRRSLPDWMPAAIENCDTAFVELKAARMASNERLYRMIVQQEYEYQRLQE